MVSIEFLMATLIVVLIPGTGVMYTLSVGLLQGKSKVLYASIGCTLSILPHIMLSILSLVFLFQLDAQMVLYLKLMAFMYLLYFAYGFVFSKWQWFSLKVNKDSKYQIIQKGFLLNVFNIKLTLFLVAFLPQFISSKSHTVYQIFLHSGIFMLMTFVVFIGYGILAAHLKRHLFQNERVLYWTQKGFGIIFLYLAVQVIL
jgi:threonine/homoserine/homoserine lactone efflux protein